MRILRLESEKYSAENKRNYWDDLIKTEEIFDHRFLGRTGKFSWFCPFASSSNHEINVTFSGIDLQDFTKNDIKLLSNQIVKILQKYQAPGYSSFNFPLMRELSKEASLYINAFFIITPRQNVYNNYRNDVNFLGKIHKTHFLSIDPEESK
jgi:galactose-1-phosphate uridylyltransferase